MPLSKQRQLSASVAANDAKPANRLIGQHHSAATIDGVENDMHAGCLSIGNAALHEEAQRKITHGHLAL